MSDDTRKPGYGQVDHEYGLKLATTDPADERPVWMVNLMRYHEVAQYADGREAAISGQEADDRYSPIDVLTDIGAEPVFFAEVDSQLLGDSPKWDRVGIVKYPTRRSFIEMQRRPDFQEKHIHKEAGMAETIVMGCRPIPSPADGTDPATFPDWSEVPHPATEDDGPVTVLHVIRFHPGQAETNMVEYQNHAGDVAVPHGVRISGWFGVEGTIVGDGRQWDQVRCNAFPSKAAFMAVAHDPNRLEAQHEHRETAIADTYTMILRPTIDRLAAGI
ncbi:MAG TPA: hypothetical protein VFF40_02030 [Acidimicrobiia bacterium]|nr:hypothetical protein [Acidimicrobiia bacterium]